MIQVEWLRARLDLDLRGVAKVISAYPGVFTRTAAYLDGKLSWLRDFFAIDSARAKRVMAANPVLFSLSTASMEAKVTKNNTYKKPT